MSLGRDLATGKYRRRCRNVHGTYGETQRALRELIAETEAGRSTTRCGDIDGLTVSITHTMDNTGKPREKTKMLYRTRRIPISKSLRAAFDARLAYMEEHGIPTGPEDPIICNDVGEWMKPGVSSQWWALGFDGYTVHDMRHSFASKMARDEVNPKVLQRILGHGQFSTTMDIYVHVTDEQMREACDKADW